MRLEIESDDLIHGVFIHITDEQEVKVYRTFSDIDEGNAIEVNLSYEFYCPSCESWNDPENWTGKYICSSCAWDVLETEAYGESLNND
jgi:hypothetical protein